MSKYEIVTDTACDLSVSFLDNNNIKYVPFSVSFDKETYYKEHVDIELKEFLRRLEEDKLFAKTSLPSIGDYQEVFEEKLEKGIDVLCICISSKLSGSYQSACTAADILSETFPDRNIKVLDSIQACAAEGMLVIKALENLNNNMTLEDNFNFLENMKYNIKTLFTVNDLSYLQRGGRLTATSAFVGNVLDIKPILTLDNGIITPFHKVRKLKKTVQYLVKHIVSISDESPNGIEVALINSGLDEALEIFIEELAKHNIKTIYPISHIGITISAHIGYGASGIVVYKK